MNCFSFPSVRLLTAGAASGFTVQGEAAGEAIPDVFSGELLLPARKNLPEMHFKAEGTGTAAYIRTDKTCGGGGMDDEKRKAPGR